MVGIMKTVSQMDWLFFLCPFPPLSLSITIHLPAFQHTGVEYSVEQKPQMSDLKYKQFFKNEYKLLAHSL